MSYRLSSYSGSPAPLVGIHQPDIRPIGRRLYRLATVYEVWVTISGTAAKQPITVPAGFELDGASVPLAAWAVIGLTPDGLIRAAALVHDYLYRNHGHAGNGLLLTRMEADRLFLSLMLAAGVRPLRARLAYRAVRLLGRRW